MNEDSEISKAFDMRRRLLLDEIRARFWVQQIMEISGARTAYGLDKEFGGGQKKWSSYLKGRVPNQETVTSVEEKFRGTADLLTRGPIKLALWPALDPRASNELLDRISRYSQRIDGDIARLRIEVASGNLAVIPEYFVHIVDPNRNPFYGTHGDRGDDFMCAGFGLFVDLLHSNIVSREILDLIGVQLYQLIAPHRNLAYKIANEDEYYYVDGFRAFPDKELIESEAYWCASVDTLGSKGSRTRR